jgi:hypothetical protein
MQPDGEATERWRRLRKSFQSVGDDTAERLRYASEWESSEDNPARALLIRLQIRMAQIGPDHPAWFRLRTKTEEILLDHEQSMIPRWFRELGIRDPVFYRGFVEGCVVPFKVLINPRYREQLFDFSPIRHLTVTGMEEGERVDLLFGSVEFRNLVSLAMDRQRLTDQSLRSLSEYHPSKLRWLSIRNNDLTSDSLEWLTSLPALEHVDFSGHGPESEEEVQDDQGVILSRTPPALAGRFPFLRGPMPNRYELWRAEAVTASR